jgi:hypothetical protein
VSASTLAGLGPPALRRLRVHRYAALFRPLAGDERTRLRESLQRGYDPLHPIVVTAGSGEIVDGRNRRDLACELGLTVPVVEREFADDAAIARFILAENVARRHLDQRERRELAGRLVNGHGLSTRQAAKTAGVSQMTAQRAAVEQRTSESDDSPRPATQPRPDPRIAQVRRALDVLSRLAGEPIPDAIEEALSADELAVLVSLLDALSKTGARAA